MSIPMPGAGEQWATAGGALVNDAIGDLIG